MPEPSGCQRAIRVVLFVGVGLLLIATSDPPQPQISFSSVVDVPASVLDNSALEQRVTFSFARLDDSEEVPTEAEVSITLQASHSDDAPQRAANNTPWVTARELSALPGTAGAAAPVPAGESASFLTEHWLSLPAALGADGRGELTVMLERSPTATEITTQVQWQVVFRSSLSASKDERRPLPWDIAVQVEGGAR